MKGTIVQVLPNSRYLVSLPTGKVIQAMVIGPDLAVSPEIGNEVEVRIDNKALSEGIILDYRTLVEKWHGAYGSQYEVDAKVGEFGVNRMREYRPDLIPWLKK